MVMQRESLDRHLRVLGPENIGTINAMLNFAELQRDTGQDDAAIKTLNELMVIERRVLDPDQGEISATKYDLASVLVRKGKADEALALLDGVIDNLARESPWAWRTIPCLLLFMTILVLQPW